MSKLSIFDIVALAKAGYKASDIKELTSVDVPEEDKSGNENEADAPSETPVQPPAENSAKETEKVEGGTGTGDNDIDYKKLYEEKCNELENAQKLNTKMPIPQNETENKASINDIVRRFM